MFNVDGERSVDKFHNVLEGTRQYFLGVPKQVQGEVTGQPVWPAAPPEEVSPAESGAPAFSSRPPSTAAAPPSTPTSIALSTIQLPRPPSEPLEPEPHIIHKPTVMREAAEKRLELPESEDDDEASRVLSPPSHIIHKPPQRVQASPAPTPAAPCPSPARPPTDAPSFTPSTHDIQSDPHKQYRSSLQRGPAPTMRPPDPFAPARLPDPYSASRPPEHYSRYHYEQNVHGSGRSSHDLPVMSPQPSAALRNSPQLTYARITNSMTPQMTPRLRDTPSHNSSSQRYAIPPIHPPPPHNDRVPPIHHPSSISKHRQSSVDSQSHIYSQTMHRRESASYDRPALQHERHVITSPRKYDHQKSYSGYRQNSAVTQPISNYRIEPRHHKHVAVDVINTHYAAKPPDSAPAPVHPHQNDAARVPTRVDHSNMTRNMDSRNSYQYATPSTSTVKYGSIPTISPVQASTVQPSTPYRPVPKSYDYLNQNIQAPTRAVAKSVISNQQSRQTVAVTTIVNQMRQSPLDLSVKTVKNSADSSTMQDDSVDSATSEKSTPVQSRIASSSRHTTQSFPVYNSSHKVDFAPDFTSQYRDRNPSHVLNSTSQSGHPSVRFNGSYESVNAAVDSYPVESRHQVYPDRSRYSAPRRSPYASRIDLTRNLVEERRHDNRIRDERNVSEERKRPAVEPIANVPEKMVRYETWSADSRIDRLNQSVREQQHLISQPVYSYKAYQNEQKRTMPQNNYRDSNLHQTSSRYSYAVESAYREYTDYRTDRIPPSNNRPVIQKLAGHREMHQLPHNHLDLHKGVPADERVLSILRNSLETKQKDTDSTRPLKEVPDLIVIDDAEDSVIVITDDNELEVQTKLTSKTGQNEIAPIFEHHIQMPKAIDSIPRDSEYKKIDNHENTKSKSPENDVASRIRTKAELKVIPPSQDNSVKEEINKDSPLENEVKLLPKSQKQHLFNQIREDNLRLESVIKQEKPLENMILEVKTEPMNIEEIEKDAEECIKIENVLDSLETNNTDVRSKESEDLDWASACDNFVEQLKTGCHKRKSRRKRMDTSENEGLKISENTMQVTEEECKTQNNSNNEIVIKQEPVEDDTEVQKQDDPNQVEIISSEKEILNQNLDVKVINQSNKIVPDNETVIIKKEKVETDIEKSSVIQKNIKNTKSSKTHNIEGENELVCKNLKKQVIQQKNDKLNRKSINEKSRTLFKPKIKSYRRQNSPTTSKNSTVKQKPSKIVNKDEIKTSDINGTKQTLTKCIIKDEIESTDDDEPLIKSKLLKEKEKSDKLKHQLLKDLSEKSVYVKLECCVSDLNKNTRKSIESPEKGNERIKSMRLTSKSKCKSVSSENIKLEQRNTESSTDTDEDEVSVASRLRVRKSLKSDVKGNDIKKSSTQLSLGKKTEISSSCSTPVRKPGFGDGSDFHPGWEEELYRYKRSLRMPPRLIAIPRGRSGGPFVKGNNSLFTRGSTSLPDLDSTPLSPAPSSAPSTATDDFYTRRPDKLAMDSDAESNSSCSLLNRFNYDSEASTSNSLSTPQVKKKGSIVDVLIQKYGRKEDSKRRLKDKDGKSQKVIAKSSNELLPTPNLSLVKNGNKQSLSVKKEQLMEDVFYLGACRKETVSAFRSEFITNTDGSIGTTEEFPSVMLKTRTRTESRVLKQRATIKEVFGDERPASAPPTSYREVEETSDVKSDLNIKEESETKTKLKSKKIMKGKLQRRTSSIRDGLRSTKSLKSYDAKGRMLRLKKRNNLLKSLAKKRIKDISSKPMKSEKKPITDDKEEMKDDNNSPPIDELIPKKRFKRIFAKRKLSSGFDYIRKKKKIIRRDENNSKIRRPAVKPSPESVQDIQKEIKGWFINKSIGETHLHRAARLGYTDCVAYCLEKMGADPSARDNAGFTPLHVSAAKGYVRIARLLLQYGADVSAAAQGGIRPLHEACDNSHVEVIRLLLSYGADPLLVTYSDQKPEELAEGAAALLLRLHITDVQGQAVEPWRFPPPTEIIDSEEIGCDPLASPPPGSPPPASDSPMEMLCTEAPLPPFYSFKPTLGQPPDGLWCLLQDVTNMLQIKSKDSLLKQIHCGSGSPRDLYREVRTQEFLERAQCHQLLCAGEKVNVRASKVALVRVTDKLRQLLKMETVLVS